MKTVTIDWVEYQSAFGNYLEPNKGQVWNWPPKTTEWIYMNTDISPASAVDTVYMMVKYPLHAFITLHVYEFSRLIYGTCGKHSMIRKAHLEDVKKQCLDIAAEFDRIVDLIRKDCNCNENFILNPDGSEEPRRSTRGKRLLIDLLQEYVQHALVYYLAFEDVSRHFAAGEEHIPGSNWTGRHRFQSKITSHNEGDYNNQVLTDFLSLSTEHAPKSDDVDTKELSIDGTTSQQQQLDFQEISEKLESVKLAEV
ncbi:hypothetical protein ABW21_db0209342 [Orbilia brochopaga]|nr:hypothetical protein ABW21_db0209342 [Drechslerella brochopaga]